MSEPPGKFRNMKLILKTEIKVQSLEKNAKNYKLLLLWTITFVLIKISICGHNRICTYLCKQEIRRGPKLMLFIYTLLG